jgi:hypothetical protein
LSNDFTHRNHYIPQRYQLGFANENGSVWLFDRKELQFRNGAPVNIGVQRDFYTTVDANGVPNDSVEKMLALIEGIVWPVIDRLDRRADGISEHDRAHLALFVAFMRTRTPAFDQMSNNISDAIFKWLVKARNPTPEVVAEDYARATGRTIDMAEAREIFDVIHNDGFAIKAPRQNNIKMMLEIAVKLGEAIVAMDWTIYSTTSHCAFVTSDNPFLVLPPAGSDSTLTGTGPLSPGATCLIPLSSKTLLCVCKNGSGLFKYVKATRDFVRFVNIQVVAVSNRFFVARDEALLRKLVKVTKADQWQNSFMPSVIVPDPSDQ